MLKRFKVEEVCISIDVNLFVICKREDKNFHKVCVRV